MPSPKRLDKMKAQKKEKKKRERRRTIGVTLLIIGAVFLAYVLLASSQPSGTTAPGTTTGQTTSYTPPPVTTYTPPPVTTTSTPPLTVAPEFTLRDINGNTITMSGLRGRVVVLEFMSTTCPHCQNEMAQLVTVWKQYGSSITMVSVDLYPSDTDETLKSFAATYQAPWIWARDTTGVNTAYRVSSIPTLFIIDPTGTIVSSFIGETPAADLSRQIQTAMPPSASTTSSTLMVAPDFTLSDINGKTFRLSDFHGRVVVLEFMSTTCPHCQNEMAQLVTVWKQYGSSITMVSVDLYSGDTDVTLKNFTTSYHAPWVWARDPSGATAAYNVQAVPRILIINANGLIVATFTGETPAVDLSQQIQAAMKR